MFYSRWVILAGMLSFSALAEVSHLEKVARVKEMEEALKASFPTISLDAYQRELKYEAQELPLEQRAKLETNKLAATVRKQVHQMYQNAFERLGDVDAAAEEIKESIERDSALLAPELQQEIQQLALEELRLAQEGEGASSHEIQLEETEKHMLNQASERSTYLNQIELLNDGPSRLAQMAAAGGPVDGNADKPTYANDTELLSALNSHRPSTRWMSTGGWDLNLSSARRSEGRIKVQFKVEFLGNSVNAGPALFVKREFSANLKIIADNKSDLILSNGHFDFTERDFEGKPLMEKGKVKKRFAAFACEAILFYEIDLSAATGFNIAAGPGISGLAGATANLESHVAVATANRSSVNLQSRRIAVPESVGGKIVSLNYLKEICLNRFHDSRSSSKKTVIQQLNVQLTNLLRFVTLSHPKMNCSTDSHCTKWFKRGFINKWGKNAYPRCATNLRENIKNCVIRASRGGKCSVIEGGKLTSNGINELACDNGLHCVKVQSKGWFPRLNKVFQYAEGRCAPNSAKSYRAPAPLK